MCEQILKTPHHKRTTKRYFMKIFQNVLISESLCASTARDYYVYQFNSSDSLDRWTDSCRVLMLKIQDQFQSMARVRWSGSCVPTPGCQEPYEFATDTKVLPSNLCGHWQMWFHPPAATRPSDPSLKKIKNIREMHFTSSVRFSKKRASHQDTGYQDTDNYVLIIYISHQKIVAPNCSGCDRIKVLVFSCYNFLCLYQQCTHHAIKPGLPRLERKIVPTSACLGSVKLMYYAPERSYNSCFHYTQLPKSPSDI